MVERPNLAYKIPKVVIAPLEGEDAQRIYEAVPQALRLNTKYDPKSKTVIGSTNLLAVGVDDVVQPLGLRALSLADLSRPEVMEFVRGKHYVDSRSLVARSAQDPDWASNNDLLRRVNELVEGREGSLRFPFMIEGFSYLPDQSKSYGVTITPKDDFKVISDERFSGKHNGKKFNKVDELGLPLFDRNGSRTWYTRNEGLSRLCLYLDLDLDSDARALDYSYDDGRVVVVSAEGTSPENLQEDLMNRLNSEYSTQLEELKARRAEAERAVHEIMGRKK